MISCEFLSCFWSTFKSLLCQVSLVRPGRRRRDDTKLVDGGVGERVGHGTSWDMALAALAALAACDSCDGDFLMIFHDCLLRARSGLCLDSIFLQFCVRPYSFTTLCRSVGITQQNFEEL